MKPMELVRFENLLFIWIIFSINDALCHKVNLFNVTNINEFTRGVKNLNGEDRRNISAHVASHKNDC